MSAKVESQAEHAAPGTRGRPRHGYRVMVLSDDGYVQEAHLPAVVQWLSYAVPIVLAIALSGLMLLFGAYLHANRVNQVQSARIHHLATTVTQGRKVIRSYQEGLTLTSAITSETAQLISTLKSAQSRLARITGKRTPGAEGLAGILKVLEQIEAILPTPPKTTGSH